MEANQITKQALDFQKGVFSSWYGAMSIVQDQAALAVDTMLNQASWISDERRQAMLSWVSTCKKERDRLKRYLEDSLSGLEKYLGQEIKAAPAKPQKPNAEEIKAAPAKPQKPNAEEIKAAPAKAQKPNAEEIKAAPAKAQKTASEEIKAAPAQETKKAAQ
jgi:hypothetical protein